MTDDDFSLHNLSNERLDLILSMDEEQKLDYVTNLVTKYFPTALQDEEQFEKLAMSYLSSFILEKLYRNNAMFQKGFSIVYTKHGMIRDVINDLYFNEEELITH